MAQEIPVEGRLVLADDITLQSAETVHARLLAMAGQPVVEIDCSGATAVDLSFVQLILAARANASRTGQSFAMAQPAAGALRETLVRGGFLSAVMDQPTADQAFWLQASRV